MVKALTGIAAALMVAICAVATGAATAHATYPPPTGNVTVGASDQNVSLGGSTQLTVTVRDVNGDPIADTDCTLAVTRQPGSDASVDSAATTDSDGVIHVTLDVGTTAGAIEVTARCGPNAVLGRVGVVAGTAFAPASDIEAPNTGFGPQDEGSAAGSIAALLTALAIGLAGAGICVAGTRRRA